MSRKIYTQAQMTDAIHNAKNEARHKQIVRSARTMQDYVNKNDALILEVAEKEVVIRNLLEKIDVKDTEITNLTQTLGRAVHDKTSAELNVANLETEVVAAKAENVRLKQENDVLNEENQRIISEKEALLNTNHRLRAGRA